MFLNNVNELQKIQQLMEIWVESFDAFCLSTNALIETWNAYYSHTPYLANAHQPPPAYRDVSSELNQLFTTVQKHVQPTVHETFTNRCLKPVVGILSFVPELHDQLQQRKNYLSDFDTYKNKIQKEHAAGRDNSHPNVMKKAAKLDESAKKLHELQTTINNTLQEFEHARTQTLGPELAAFVACCHTFAATIHNSTSRILPLIPQATSSLAALDYSSISNELKLHTPVPKTEKKPIAPIYERPDSMGGKAGGYGYTSQIPDANSQFDLKRLRSTSNDNQTDNKKKLSLSDPLEANNNITPRKATNHGSDVENGHTSEVGEEEEEEEDDEENLSRMSTSAVRFSDRILPTPPDSYTHPPQLTDEPKRRFSTDSDRSNGVPEPPPRPHPRTLTLTASASSTDPLLGSEQSREASTSTKFFENRDSTPNPPPKPPKPPKNRQPSGGSAAELGASNSTSTDKS
jgi:hypothetical protein